MRIHPRIESEITSWPCDECGFDLRGCFEEDKAPLQTRCPECGNIARLTRMLVQETIYRSARRPCVLIVSVAPGPIIGAIYALGGDQTLVPLLFAFAACLAWWIEIAQRLSLRRRRFFSRFLTTMAWLALMLVSSALAGGLTGTLLGQL